MLRCRRAVGWGTKAGRRGTGWGPGCRGKGEAGGVRGERGRDVDEMRGDGGGMARRGRRRRKERVVEVRETEGRSWRSAPGRRGGGDFPPERAATE